MPKKIKNNNTIVFDQNDFNTNVIESTQNESFENKTQLKEYKVKVDENINPWIVDIEEKDRERLCNQYMRIGYMISGMTTTTMNSEVFMRPIYNSMERMFMDFDHKNELNLNIINTKVSENLDRVKTSIDKFTEFSNKSSFKGAMGENLIESIVQSYFPDDTITNMSKKTAESDYHMRCHNNTMFLIESKFYSSVVNKQEIEKFKRDLVKTGFPIGIFISLSSGIVGKKRFDIESLNKNQKILYVPNAGLDGGSIVWSILFAKEIHRYQIDNQREIDEEELTDLQEVYDSFQEVYQYFSTLKLQILDTRSVVIKQMDDLMQKTLEIHYQINGLIGDMRNKIQKRLWRRGDVDRREIEVNVEESIMKMRDNGDNENELIYMNLWEMCKRKGIQVDIDENNEYDWRGYLGSEEIFRIKVLTKKRELVLLKEKITFLLTLHNINKIECIIDSIE